MRILFKTAGTMLLAYSAWIPLLTAMDKMSVADLPRYATEQSQITAAGSQPFHLRAKVLEATNPENDRYKAEIEEYWAAPDQWKRTVKANGFSQTIVVNGEKVSESLTGDYYPNWLHTLVNAIFDPGVPLQGVDLTKSSDNPIFGGGSKLCRRFTSRAGIPPVGNNVFSTYCFENGLIDSIGKPGYDAIYTNYKKFAGKQVARTIREYIEPGEEVEAAIEVLDELPNPDKPLFAVDQPTASLKTIQVNEEVLRGLAIDPPPMQWPVIHGGKPAGVLSVYVCLDRQGKIRETHALNSDHPEMSDAARKQLASWHFKTATQNGVPVQVEGILTFAYTTKLVR